MKRPVGLPPRSNEQVRKLGNPGHRVMGRQADAIPLAPVKAAPAAPDSFGKVARETWKRVWEYEAHWIAETDIETVTQYCLVSEDLVFARAEMYRKVAVGEDPWRLRVQVSRLRKELFVLISALGFSPADRTRLGIGEVMIAAKAQKIADSVTSSRKPITIEAVMRQKSPPLPIDKGKKKESAS